MKAQVRLLKIKIDVPNENGVIMQLMEIALIASLITDTRECAFRTPSLKRTPQETWRQVLEGGCWILSLSCPISRTWSNWLRQAENSSHLHTGLIEQMLLPF